eukprot:TRINITY_DN79649_c0_g1_i1.p1 TRINITY_DN79649_c0_g1~~TRINITY_DN79649_c0_g1_i1.p1  ORF type:complete len:334 (-),score=64.00 TRINITY_DN79649_c0_g1_i1:13-1014(-)
MKLPQPPLDCISRVRFSPSNSRQRLLASSWDAHVRLYDVDAQRLIGLHKQPLPILDCAFAQDTAKCFLAGLQRTIDLYDFEVQRETRIGQHSEAIKCVEWHDQTQQVFTASWDRELRAWDVRQPKTATSVVDLGAKAFSMDVGKDRVIVGGSDRCVQVFDPRMLASPLERRESSLKHQIRCVKVGPDQQCFASGSVEGRVAMEYFDQEENQQSRFGFKCHRVREAGAEEKIYPVNTIAFHPVHGTFATGGSDGGVCVWDGSAKKRLWKLNPFHTAVSSLDFSADGSMLAIGVSYSFDEGERMPPPVPELVVRPITDCEVMPKARQQDARSEMA